MREVNLKSQSSSQCQRRKALPITGINCCRRLSSFSCRLFEELLLTTELCLELILLRRKKKSGQTIDSSFELQRAIDFSLRFLCCSQEEGEREESNSLIRAEGHVHLLASCHVPLFPILNVY